ncbi:MAG: hypothetical protein JWR50_2773, partial [Mucilaginibacter sp.]|nr:hypothetical protein [Mucilaginibacter sp.]
MTKMTIFKILLVLYRSSLRLM